MMVMTGSVRGRHDPDGKGLRVAGHTRILGREHHLVIADFSAGWRAAQVAVSITVVRSTSANPAGSAR